MGLFRRPGGRFLLGQAGDHGLGVLADVDHHIEVTDLLPEHVDLSGDSLDHSGVLDGLALVDQLLDDVLDVHDLLLQDDGSLADDLVDSLDDSLSVDVSRVELDGVDLSDDASDATDKTLESGPLLDDLDSDVGSLDTSDLGHLLLEVDDGLPHVGDVLPDVGDLDVEVVNVGLHNLGQASDLSVSEGGLPDDSDELLVDVHLGPEVDDLGSQLPDDLVDAGLVDVGATNNQLVDLPGDVEDSASDHVDLLLVHSGEVGEGGRD